MTVTVRQPEDIGQKWLDANQPDTSVKPADLFYGCYAIDSRGTEPLVGTLSVNGHSDQVWFQVWNGTFIQSRELGG